MRTGLLNRTFIDEQRSNSVKKQVGRCLCACVCVLLRISGCVCVCCVREHETKKNTREQEREREKEGKAGPTPLTELVSKWASKTQCY